VNALAVWGTDLYAGGAFTMAGGIEAYYIAKWSGSSWSALGWGLDDRAEALAVSGSDLYVGGQFWRAGRKTSPGIARAIVNPGNWLTLQAGVPGPNTNTLTYVGVPDSQYLMQFATNLTTGPWFNLDTNTVGANGRGTVQDPTATNAQRLYRLVPP
jgi:hypothetical protein